jgi:hypothetical protein
LEDLMLANEDFAHKSCISLEEEISLLEDFSQESQEDPF